MVMTMFGVQTRNDIGVSDSFVAQDQDKDV